MPRPLVALSSPTVDHKPARLPRMVATILAAFEVLNAIQWSAPWTADSIDNRAHTRFR